MEALFSNSHHQFLPYDTQPSQSKSQTNNNNNNITNNNNNNTNTITANDKEIPNNEDVKVGNTEGNIDKNNTKENSTKEEEKQSIKLHVVQLLRQWIMKFWDIFQEDNQLRRLMKTLVWMHIHFRMIVDGSVDNADDIIRAQRLMLTITRSIVESKVSDTLLYYSIYQSIK